MRFIYNSSDELQEIVSLDDRDITQAQKVWRWNNGGFGFSSTGYNGPYTLAITQNGAIVADFITAGTLNANVIRAGILQDAAGKNAWNLDTGALTITNGSINIVTEGGSFDVITLIYRTDTVKTQTSLSPGGLQSSNEISKYQVRVGYGNIYQTNYGANPNVAVFSLENGVLSFRTTGGTLRLKMDNAGNFRQYDTNGTERTFLQPDGTITLSNDSGTLRQKLDSNGKLWQYDTNGKVRTYLEYGDIYLKDASEVIRTHLNSQGHLLLADSTGANRVAAYGTTGGIWLQKASDVNTSVFITDTADKTRTRLGTDGLNFFNASGTQTNIVRPDGYVLRTYIAGNVSLTLSTKDINVYDYGRFAIVRVNLHITSGFNAGTLYPLCNIGDSVRTVTNTITQFVPNQTGTSAALVQIDTNGTLNIYRYSGSGAFTGWFRCTIAVPFSNV
jgi:hypothetical protein